MSASIANSNFSPIQLTGEAPASFFVAGEAMPGFHNFVKIDSFTPLRSWYESHGLSPDDVREPYAFDMDGYIKRHFNGMPVTWRQLEQLVLESVYAGLYNDLKEKITEKLPVEWSANLDAHVRDLGSEQMLQTGVLKMLAFFICGGDIELAKIADSCNDAVRIAGGLFGGTGAAFLLTAPTLFNSMGKTSSIRFGISAHAPSIGITQVVSDSKGVPELVTIVRESKALRAKLMAELCPDMIMMNSLQVGTEDPSENCWADLDALALRTGERLSNAGTIVKTAADGRALAPNLLLMGMHLLPSIFDRYFMRLFANPLGSLEEQRENARKVLITYLEKGYLDFTKPGTDGYSSLRLRKVSAALQLKHLDKLMPALLYVQYNPVDLQYYPSGNTRRRVKKARIQGSDAVEKIMKRLNLDPDIDDIRVIGNNFAGMGAYEAWLLSGAQNGTQKAAMKTWTQNWPNICKTYIGSLLEGTRQGFTPTTITFGDERTRFWQLSQPLMTYEELALLVTGYFGTVQDPWQRARDEEAAIQAARKSQAHAQELENRIKGYKKE